MARPPINRSESDVVLWLCHWQTRKNDDECEYFYRYELDGEGLLKHLFWADTDSMVDNGMGYGDVVVFDTTCLTNKNGVAFVPFVGLSQHRTPILLGCGVTSDRSLDSFVWLLRAFKQSSAPRDGPASLITDDSDAVVGAVKAVFPGAGHRFCSSHVEEGIQEHLGDSPAAENEFRALMYHGARSSPAAFERRWNRFVATHTTPANQRWLDDMYGKREMWAAPFVHDKFFLGMADDQSTQCLASPLVYERLQGLSVPNLWHHFGACAISMRSDAADLDDDQAAAMPEPELTTDRWRRRVEEHAARLFTRANFFRVSNEIQRASFGIDVVAVTRKRDAASGDVTYIYTVAYQARWSVCSPFKHLRGEEFTVERSGGDVVKCSCRKMERDGVPCLHIFRVMRYASMTQIPACCVLRRMKRRCQPDDRIEWLDELKNLRNDELMNLGREVFDLASKDAGEFQEMKEFLETWLERKRGGEAAGAGASAVEDNDDDASDVESM